MRFTQAIFPVSRTVCLFNHSAIIAHISSITVKKIELRLKNMKAVLYL